MGFVGVMPSPGLLASMLCWQCQGLEYQTLITHNKLIMVPGSMISGGSPTHNYSQGFRKLIKINCQQSDVSDINMANSEEAFFSASRYFLEGRNFNFVSNSYSSKQEYFHFKGILSWSRDSLFVGSVSGFEYLCLGCIEHLANL